MNTELNVRKNSYLSEIKKNFKYTDEQESFLLSDILPFFSGGRFTNKKFYVAFTRSGSLIDKRGSEDGEIKKILAEENRDNLVEYFTQVFVLNALCDYEIVDEVSGQNKDNKQLTKKQFNLICKSFLQLINEYHDESKEEIYHRSWEGIFKAQEFLAPYNEQEGKTSQMIASKEEIVGFIADNLPEIKDENQKKDFYNKLGIKYPKQQQSNEEPTRINNQNNNKINSNYSKKQNISYEEASKILDNFEEISNSSSNNNEEINLDNLEITYENGSGGNDDFTKTELQNLLKSMQTSKKLLEIVNKQKVFDYILTEVAGISSVKSNEKDNKIEKLKEIFTKYKESLTELANIIDQEKKIFQNLFKECNVTEINSPVLKGILHNGFTKINRESYQSICRECYNSADLLVGLDSLELAFKQANINIAQEFSKEEESIITDLKQFIVTMNDMIMLKEQQKNNDDNDNRIRRSRINVSVIKFEKYMLEKYKEIREKITTISEDRFELIKTNAINFQKDNYIVDYIKNPGTLFHDLIKEEITNTSTDDSIIDYNNIDGLIAKLNTKLTEEEKQLKEELKKETEEYFQKQNKFSILYKNFIKESDKQNKNNTSPDKGNNSSKGLVLSGISEYELLDLVNIQRTPLASENDRGIYGSLDDRKIFVETTEEVVEDYKREKGNDRITSVFAIHDKLKDTLKNDKLENEYESNKENLLDEILNNVIDNEKINVNNESLDKADKNGILKIQEEFAKNEILCKKDAVYENTNTEEDPLYFGKTETNFNYKEDDAEKKEPISKTLICSNNSILPDGYTLRIENIPMEDTYEKYIKDIRENGLENAMKNNKNIAIYNKEGKRVFGLLEQEEIGTISNKFKKPKLGFTIGGISSDDENKVKNFNTKIKEIQKTIDKNKSNTKEHDDM